MTPNGKLDTRALPAPEYTAGRVPRPGHAVEEILAGIYAQVLGVERVGVDDSFFDLGGDSLSAMRLIAAVNTGLDAGLSVRAVFEAPTVARLASRVGGGAGRLGAVGGRPAACGGAVVVCPEPGCGLSISCRGPRRFTTCRWRCGCAGALDAEALGAALGDVVGRHESLRTLFPAPEGIPSAGGCRLWSGPTWAGRSLMPPAGRQARLDEAIERGGASPV